MTWFWRGIISGLGGAFAMQQFRSTWNARVAMEPRDGVFGLDDEADINAVNLLAQCCGQPGFKRQEALRIALRMHYGYGALVGVLYEWLAKEFSFCKSSHGLLFGILLWLTGDEVFMSLTGVSKVSRKSAASHASALAAHLLFAVVLESARNPISRTSQFSI